MEQMARHLEYPAYSLYRAVLETAKRYPELTALEYFGRRISYRRLIGEISRTARALSAEGVGPGDMVSICLPNIPEAVYLFYAVNKLGAVANMIHPLSGENEIVRYMELTGSRALFALDAGAEKAKAVCDRVGPSLRVLVSPGKSMPTPMKAAYAVKTRGQGKAEGFLSWRGFIGSASACPSNIRPTGSAGDTAAILYSGGTTGKPKGIMLTNLNFNALALQSINGCGGLEPGDRMLSVMPIFHGFGLGVCIHTMLVLGGTAIILPKFSARDFHKLVFKYRPNIIAGVPAIYEAMLVSGGLEGKPLDFLKCVISGGDSLSPSTKQKLNEALKAQGCRCTVREGYGLTECVTGSCLIPDGSDRLTSVGLPYADTFYKIIDEEDRELPAGEEGQIILRGPSVMKGYYREPEETAQTLRVREDGHTWLYTGDLGAMDEDGYVYFRQRLKRMIVSGGYNIYPQNLEEVINSHPQVVMCAVVGVPDSIMGQRVRACIAAVPGVDKEALRQELLERLRKDIAAYALPREMVFMEELPRTLVGKVAYNELMTEASEG